MATEQKVLKQEGIHPLLMNHAIRAKNLSVEGFFLKTVNITNLTKTVQKKIRGLDCVGMNQ